MPDDRSLEAHAKSSLIEFNTFFKRRRNQLIERFAGDKMMPADTRVRLLKELETERELKGKDLKRALDYQIDVLKSRIETKIKKIHASINKKGALAKADKDRRRAMGLPEKGRTTKELKEKGLDKFRGASLLDPKVVAKNKKSRARAR